MVRLPRPLKGLVLAGTLAVGCWPGVAQAKWIKATVTNAMVISSYDTTQGSGDVAPNDLSPGNFVNLTFIIQNYTGTPGTPYIWNQTSVQPNYLQLFGYGTGTNSTGIGGNYNSSSLPYDSTRPGPVTGDGNFIASNSDGSDFSLRVGTQGSSSGLTITKTFSIGNASSYNVEYINLFGGNSSTGGTLNLNNSTATDIVDFLSASLGNRTCTGSNQQQLADSCVGTIQPSGETPITFAWNSITFEQIEAVPAPLPIAGALAGFKLSRKIRCRIKAS